MKIKKILLFYFAVFLLFVYPVSAYKTYIGIKLSSVNPANFYFPVSNTGISISPGGYSQPTLNPDADGRWTVDETTYTNAIDLTPDTEYTITVSSSGCSDLYSTDTPGRTFNVTRPRASGYYWAADGTCSIPGTRVDPRIYCTRSDCGGYATSCGAKFASAACFSCHGSALTECITLNSGNCNTCATTGLTNNCWDRIYCYQNVAFTFSFKFIA